MTSLAADVTERRYGSYVYGALTSTWLSTEAAYIFLTRQGGDWLDFDSTLEHIRFDPSDFVAQTVRNLLGLIPFSNYIKSGLSSVTTALSSLSTWFANAARLAGDLIESLARLPLVWYGALGLIIYLWWTSRMPEDTQLRSVVQAVASSPYDAWPPPDPATHVGEDPVEDAFSSLSRSPYENTGFTYIFHRAFSGASLFLAYLARLLGRLRAWLRSGRYLWLLTPIPLLLEVLLGILGETFADRTLWEKQFFDIVIYRRRLQRPRFLKLDTKGTYLDVDAYGSHYYEVARMAPLQLRYLQGRFISVQNDTLWPIIEVEHDRHIPWFIRHFGYSMLSTPLRYAPRFLLFRLEETICLNPLGPQFLVLPSRNLVGPSTEGDPLDDPRKWKNIRPRYVHVAVRINANVEVAERSYWIWSSPLIVAGRRLEQVAAAPQHATFWNDQHTMTLVAALTEFQKSLLASRDPEPDADIELTPGDLPIRMHVTLWRNRESASETILESGIGLYDRYVRDIDRRYWFVDQKQPIDLHNERTVLDEANKLREPTSFYPIQLDVHALSVGLHQPRAGDTNATIQWILWDYLGRLADVFSWVILLRDRELYNQLRILPLDTWPKTMADDDNTKRLDEAVAGTNVRVFVRGPLLSANAEKMKPQPTRVLRSPPTKR